jgi:hypothetical protein
MYEYEYDPFGQESNLCIGTATAAGNGTQLTTRELASPVSASQLWEDLTGVL